MLYVAQLPVLCYNSPCRLMRWERGGAVQVASPARGSSFAAPRPLSQASALGAAATVLHQPPGAPPPACQAQVCPLCLFPTQQPGESSQLPAWCLHPTPTCHSLPNLLQSAPASCPLRHCLQPWTCASPTSRPLCGVGCCSESGLAALSSLWVWDAFCLFSPPLPGRAAPSCMYAASPPLPAS